MPLSGQSFERHHTMICNLTYRAERQDDGSDLHIFDGTVLEADWAALSEFLEAHPMAWYSFGFGHNTEQGYEDFECSTPDGDIATLFKLSFGGK